MNAGGGDYTTKDKRKQFKATVKINILMQSPQQLTYCL